jgi:hypothetical protein
MSTIEIKIPDELNNSILKLTNNKQSFILEAIGEKINRLQKKRFEKQLIEGYKNSGKENEQLINDFSKIDLENWDEY